ncbi:MAG: ABC transporter permease subunit [Phycisphaerae bacterium]|nr:ABC transporter permease subunit [Phycisphaerae bacterium]
MPSVSVADIVRAERVQRRKIRRAMFGKEWREQRWRFFLATIVMTALLAGLLRAQIIPYGEAALLIYWPVGCLMVIFLAMGSVASERADRTWEFLVAQPVTRADVLLTKWAVGAAQLVGMFVIATVAGLWAIWSRQPAANLYQDYGPWLYKLASAESAEAFLQALSQVSPLAWVAWLAVAATGSMLCLYTPMFLILTRARNEFTAGLGGVFLIIVAHLWLLQVGVLVFRRQWIWLPSVINPLTPLLLAVHPVAALLGPVLVPLYVFIWVFVLLWLFRRWAGRAAKS